MSRRGPSLLRCPKGYAFAKFNGRKIHFDRYDDPETRGASTPVGPRHVEEEFPLGAVDLDGPAERAVLDPLTDLGADADRSADKNEKGEEDAVHVASLGPDGSSGTT